MTNPQTGAVTQQAGFVASPVRWATASSDFLTDRTKDYNVASFINLRAFFSPRSGIRTHHQDVVIAWKPSGSSLTATSIYGTSTAEDFIAHRALKRVEVECPFGPIQRTFKSETPFNYLPVLWVYAARAVQDGTVTMNDLDVTGQFGICGEFIPESVSIVTA